MGEQLAASREIGEFAHKMETQTGWGKTTKEDIERIGKLVKVTGRRERVRGGPNFGAMGTAGRILDRMVNAHRKNLAANGELPEITPSAPTARAMAEKLALYTGGTYEWRHPTTWITSSGRRHRDASDHVEYPSSTTFEDAWGMLSGVAQGVSYRDHLGSECRALKFGKY